MGVLLSLVLMLSFAIPVILGYNKSKKVHLIWGFIFMSCFLFIPPILKIFRVSEIVQDIVFFAILFMEICYTFIICKEAITNK